MGAANDERPEGRKAAPVPDSPRQRNAFQPRSSSGGGAANQPSSGGGFPQGGGRRSSPKKNGKTQGRERPGNDPRFDKSRGVLYERPKWTPPIMSTEPLPQPDCPWCGKPIKDIAAAVQDRETGRPVHFDCIIARLGQGENLEKGDVVSYIGGGRFGIVRFGAPQEPNKLIIKKIFEWENKDDRAEWRGNISDHYSVT